MRESRPNNCSCKKKRFSIKWRTWPNFRVDYWCEFFFKVYEKRSTPQESRGRYRNVKKNFYINHECKITVKHLNGSKLYLNRKCKRILPNSFLESISKDIYLSLQWCSILHSFYENRIGCWMNNEYKLNSLSESNNMESLWSIWKRSLNKLAVNHLNINSFRIKSGNL